MLLSKSSNNRRSSSPSKSGNSHRTGAKKPKSCLNCMVVLAILAGIGIFFYNSPLFKVSDIQITGVDSTYATEIYNSVIGPVQNQKLFTIEKGYLSNLLNEKYPNLKLIDIKYNFPNKYTANVSKREEKYTVQASNGVFDVDGEGMVLGAATEASPSEGFDVIYDRSLEVGQRVQDLSLQAAFTYSEVSKNIRVENDQLHLSLDNGSQVILPQNAAVSKVNEFYTMLQKIIQKYTIDNRPIEYIDLRFNKPVIKYN